MSRVLPLFLLALNVGCDDKGSDSAGESDADTDADTDTDTDTDTDADPEYAIDGTVHLTVTDPTGKKTLCDTMVAFTGGEAAGGCLQCDYSFDLSTEILSEDGSACDYNAYPLASLHEGEVYFDQWLGLTEEYDITGGTLENLVWWGYGLQYGSSTYPGPYWGIIGYEGAAYYTATSFDGSLLGWTIDTQYLGNNLGVGYCGPYAYTGIYSKGYYGVGTPNFYGNYIGLGSLNCAYNKPYERWTFDGVDNDYAYVSVDTVAASSSFDPLFYVSTDDTCMVARADENFECSYPGASGFWCSSVKMPTTTGTHYTITVQPWDGDGDCDNATADYILYVDTSSDPGLTQGASGELYPLVANVKSEVEATISELPAK